MIRFIRLGIALGTSFVLLACSSQPSTPAEPSSTAFQRTGPEGSQSRPTIQSASATHAQKLTAVIGSGSGIVNVTPTAAVDGSFSAQINIAVYGASPDTTFVVQRAPEIGRPNSADGICQRAAGELPWGPPAPNFLTFAGVTLRTSEGGTGSVHIDFSAPAILDGTAFDVMFRLVDDLTSPTNELRTGCSTVTVK